MVLVAVPLVVSITLEFEDILAKNCDVVRGMVVLGFYGFIQNIAAPAALVDKSNWTEPVARATF